MVIARIAWSLESEVWQNNCFGTTNESVFHSTPAFVAHAQPARSPSPFARLGRDVFRNGHGLPKSCQNILGNKEGGKQDT